MKTKTTYHRDGTVTYWSVYEQVWCEHTAYVPDDDLATMPASERERVIRHLGLEES